MSALLKEEPIRGRVYRIPKPVGTTSRCTTTVKIHNIDNDIQQAEHEYDESRVVAELRIHNKSLDCVVYSPLFVCAFDDSSGRRDLFVGTGFVSIVATCLDCSLSPTLFQTCKRTWLTRLFLPFLP
uniref:Uncharacterized protein n=1 Tax=Tanacetum cinerariifolium TaxID=118510 RepID=A0A6L2N8G7_TANCI|nr:hypothetical protein [Tanacetum cinerariifolium]